MGQIVKGVGDVVGGVVKSVLGAVIPNQPAPTVAAPPPTPATMPEMPQMDESAIMAAKRKVASSLVSRSGRGSTMLTDTTKTDTLG